MIFDGLLLANAFCVRLLCCHCSISLNICSRTSSWLRMYFYLKTQNLSLLKCALTMGIWTEGYVVRYIIQQALYKVWAVLNLFDIMFFWTRKYDFIFLKIPGLLACNLIEGSCLCDFFIQLHSGSEFFWKINSHLDSLIGIKFYSWNIVPDYFPLKGFVFFLNSMQHKTSECSLPLVPTYINCFTLPS